MNEAKTFLEITREYFADKTLPLPTAKQMDRKVIDFIKLYQEPFYYDMITEYFSDWERNSAPRLQKFINKKGGMGNCIYEIKFTKYTSNNSLMSITNNRKLFTVDIPHTLDQFISDCKRAEVVLKWNETFLSENNFILLGENQEISQQ